MRAPEAREEDDNSPADQVNDYIVIVLSFLWGAAEIVIKDKVFTSPFGDRTAISARPAQPLETLAVSKAKAVPSSSAREKNGVPFFFFLPELTQVRLPARTLYSLFQATELSDLAAVPRTGYHPCD